MLWLYNAARAVGFSNLSSSTLANYLRTANNVPIPLARSWTNPGPTATPAIKQPYEYLVIWNETTFNPLPVGPAKDGWVDGLSSLK